MFYYAHFTDNKTKALRESVTFPGPDNESMNQYEGNLNLFFRSNVMYSILGAFAC